MVREKGIGVMLHCDPGSNLTSIPFLLADTKMKSTSAQQQRMSLWCSRRCVPWVLAGPDQICLQPFSPFCPTIPFATALPGDPQVKNCRSHFCLSVGTKVLVGT